MRRLKYLTFPSVPLNHNGTNWIPSECSDWGWVWQIGNNISSQPLFEFAINDDIVCFEWTNSHLSLTYNNVQWNCIYKVWENFISKYHKLATNVLRTWTCRVWTKLFSFWSLKLHYTKVSHSLGLSLKMASMASWLMPLSFILGTMCSNRCP